ncbi:unnamed protein product [Owenia fusiformis]|uniref:Peptidase S1 domain-containing protein n=1 Tax=Owenia fusiformis TaxID=6347 RepID=A0A8S4P892_OWEFU|nr:unnamed protein product [Owenia fusiformis]
MDRRRSTFGPDGLFPGYANAITYGSPSNQDGTPYTVSLEIKDGTDPTGNTWVHRCNGGWMKFDLTTAIDSTTHNGLWVVTAARCFDVYQQPSDWRAKIGARSNGDTTGVSTESIRYILRHPTSDIALVKLSRRPSELSPNRFMLNFPQSANHAATNRSCVLSGWGITDSLLTDNYENLPQEQYQGTVTGITRSWCRSQYYPSIDDATFPSDVICTTAQYGCNNCADTGPFPSPCKSYDYGTPLACIYGNEAIILGVGTAQDDSQSCGDAFAGQSIPPIWVSISTYWTWIRNTVNIN